MIIFVIIFPLKNDEVVLKNYIDALCRLPKWATGASLVDIVPLKAEGYVAKRYRK